MCLKSIVANILLFLLLPNCFAQGIPEILSDQYADNMNYLPDFSFAGYHNGEIELPVITDKVVLASDFGVVSNDGLDDSKSLLKALEATKLMPGKVVLQLPPGRIILSDILFVERSHFVLRGAGVGEGGTEIYCPRPMMYMEDPEGLTELREYLLKFDKR